MSWQGLPVCRWLASCGPAISCVARALASNCFFQSCVIHWLRASHSGNRVEGGTKRARGEPHDVRKELRVKATQSNNVLMAKTVGKGREMGGGWVEGGTGGLMMHCSQP